MLHQEEGHAGLFGQMGEELGEGLQAPRRGADTNDGEGTVPQSLVLGVRGGHRLRVRRGGFRNLVSIHVLLREMIRVFIPGMLGWPLFRFHRLSQAWAAWD